MPDNRTIEKIVVFIVSVIFPGAGHIINGHIKRAIPWTSGIFLINFFTVMRGFNALAPFIRDTLWLPVLALALILPRLVTGWDAVRHPPLIEEPLQTRIARTALYCIICMAIISVLLTTLFRWLF